MGHIKAEHELQQWLEQWFRKYAPNYSIDNTGVYSELYQYDIMNIDGHPNATILTILNIGELARDLCIHLSE